MACDPTELRAEAACFENCFLNPALEAITVSLLCKILQQLDPMATCDPETLRNDARCFEQCFNSHTLRAMAIPLLCDIRDGIGSAGVGAPLCGSGDPNGVAVGTLCGQTYLDTASGLIWAFNGVVGTNTGWV